MRPQTPPSSPILYGTATSAYQVEGMNVFADWWMEEQNGRLPVSLEAVDHWNRWEEDFLLMASAGMTAYRFSLSWPRIEPLPGRVDSRALDRYRRMVGRLHEIGLVPLVTLHHFVNPYWFYRKGGWLLPEAPLVFQRYVRTVVQALGDLVPYWITLNEPVVYAYHGFLEGIWPPFHRSFRQTFRVLAHLVRAHTLAYQTIKEHVPTARVGIAKHLIAFRPHRNAGKDRWVVHRIRRMFNEDVPMMIREGRLFPPYGNATLTPALDFLGINYYMTRTFTFSIRAPFRLFAREVPRTSAYPNTMGWTLDAEGFREVLQWARSLHLPLWITENGIATHEGHEDPVRQQFIRDHLRVLREERDRGLPVEGYLYWSLLDNYEWAEGFRPRFGLVEVDYATLACKPRASLHRFASIVREIFAPPPENHA